MSPSQVHQGLILQLTVSNGTTINIHIVTQAYSRSTYPGLVDLCGEVEDVNVARGVTDGVGYIALAYSDAQRGVHEEKGGLVDSIIFELLLHVGVIEAQICKTMITYNNRTTDTFRTAVCLEKHSYTSSFEKKCYIRG
jgi:hypothetical protein